MRTLRKGDRGEEVKQLQRALHLYDDGIFGVLTEEAVKQLQKKYGLTADGIVGPKTWAVLPDKSTVKKSRRAISRIIVHCTATPEGQDTTVEAIRKNHTAPKDKGGRGWSDIGYHYVVYRDGTVHEGRDVNISGAHCSGYNTGSIGVCYVGGLEYRPGVAYKDLKPKDTRTAAQKAGLLKLLKELKALYPKATIHGHREFANKACPCFDAKEEYKSL